MKNRQKRLFLRRFTACDCAALVLFIGIGSYLTWVLPRGISPIDESFYFSIVHRQFLGDRLLIDDWHVSQLSSVLQLFPYWVFTRLTGGTDGLILFFRQLYLFVDGILYWFFYARFRRHRFWGLAAVCIFCVYVPMTMTTLNYYTMSLQGTAVRSMLLLTGKEKKTIPTLVFTGIVLACTVLSEPMFAIVYFIWCLFVLFRALEKKERNRWIASWDLVLGGRCWTGVTAGVLLMFCCFCYFLLARSPLTEIIRTVPELFTDSEYHFGSGSNSVLNLQKIKLAVQTFGTVPFYGALAVLAGIAVFRKTGKLRQHRRWLFSVSCILFAACYCYPLIYVSRSNQGEIILCYFYCAPVLLFGLICYLLWEQKQKEALGFWIVGLLYSVMIDISSELVLGSGGAIAVFGMMPAFGGVLRELREGGHNSAGKTISLNRLFSKPVFLIFRNHFSAAAVVSLAIFLFWNGRALYNHGFSPVIESWYNTSDNRIVDTVLPRGPLKGIQTTERIAGIYSDILDDMDAIRKEHKGPLYVADRFAYCYLYADLPYACYSAWYVEADSETRTLRYWELHPDKTPEVIYIPYQDAYSYAGTGLPENNGQNFIEKKLSFVTRTFDCDVTEGRAGYIAVIHRKRV